MPSAFTIWYSLNRHIFFTLHSIYCLQADDRSFYLYNIKCQIIQSWNLVYSNYHIRVGRGRKKTNICQLLSDPHNLLVRRKRALQNKTVQTGWNAHDHLTLNSYYCPLCNLQYSQVSLVRRVEYVDMCEFLDTFFQICLKTKFPTNNKTYKDFNENYLFIDCIFLSLHKV